MHELDISETSVTDEGIKGLIEAMELICITVVDMEDLREVSQEMRDKLAAALRKNAIKYEEIKKREHLKEMRRVGDKKDDYDAKGINYVGRNVPMPVEI